MMNGLRNYGRRARCGFLVILDCFGSNNRAYGSYSIIGKDLFADASTDTRSCPAKSLSDALFWASRHCVPLQVWSLFIRARHDIQ